MGDFFLKLAEVGFLLRELGNLCVDVFGLLGLLGLLAGGEVADDFLLLLLKVLPLQI